MGVLSLVCVVAISFLPETSDKVMAETVHDADVVFHTNQPSTLNTDDVRENMSNSKYNPCKPQAYLDGTSESNNHDKDHLTSLVLA